MAVETNKSTIKVNGAVPNVAASSASALGPDIRRRRSSSLMKVANALPTVEHSLEEFIAKANQTLVDVEGWNSAEQAAKEEDVARKEQDAQRWKQAEVQMREGDAREQSLRRQLDGLQGKLAEAEARAAVAGTQMGSAAHDQTIGDLKVQIEKAMLRMRAAEEKSSELQHQLTSEKVRASTASGATMMPAQAQGQGQAYDEHAEERVRLAEAKAAKAIAAARAAAAGLTVSNADIAAIESGLAVEMDEPKKAQSPVMWIAVAALAVAATVVVLFLSGALGGKKTTIVQQAPAPAAAPAVATPEPAPTPAAAVAPVVAPAPVAAAPVTPTVTPIEEPAPTPTETAATPTPTPVPAAVVAAPVEASPAVAAEPVAKHEPAVTAVRHEPKTTSTKTTKSPTTAKSTTAAKGSKGGKSSSIADPFAEPTKKKPKEKIVDPF